MRAPPESELIRRASGFTVAVVLRYSAYTTAKTLCTNPKTPRWAQYGGHGIEFRLPQFAAFMEHLGRRPTGMVLGRISNDGHFEIGNVGWISRRKSAKNRRAHTSRIAAKDRPTDRKLSRALGHSVQEIQRTRNCTTTQIPVVVQFEFILILNWPLT
jgi:hypothetical protein